MPTSFSRPSLATHRHESREADRDAMMYEPWTPPLPHQPSTSSPPNSHHQGTRSVSGPSSSSALTGMGRANTDAKTSPILIPNYYQAAASTSAHDENSVVTSTSSVATINMPSPFYTSPTKNLPPIPGPSVTSRRGSLVQRPSPHYDSEDDAIYEIRSSPITPTHHHWRESYGDDDKYDDDIDEGDRSVRIPMLDSMNASNTGRRNHHKPASPGKSRAKSKQDDTCSNSNTFISIQRLFRRSRKLQIFTTLIVLAGVASYFSNKSSHMSLPKGIKGVGDKAKNIANKLMGEYVPGYHEMSGGNGTLIVQENGETFIYINEFGGTWDRSLGGLKARAQADTPPLSQIWDYEKETISGVNLGGWLTLEPFITPYLYEPYYETDHQAVDEWTLSENLGSSLARVLEKHYDTFITEKDFAEIAGAGLNWIRIPLPFWAIETFEGEPFLPRVSWKYFLKAVKWARKYGLRINLDLHAVPGSQNGWNHSGKSGPVNFLNGTMGIANAQRTLNYIRVLSEFIALPGSGNSEVICMFSVLNEPLMKHVSTDKHRAQWILGSFYWEAYHTVRNITGLGSGNGPVITMHDGFLGPNRWSGFMTGADRIAIDVHRYFCFRDEQSTDPFEIQATRPCNEWAAGFNLTMNRFGFVMSGEWSLATNDCGRFLNGVGMGSRFEGTFPYPDDPDPKIKAVGSCDDWTDPTHWNSTIKEGLQKVALGHMDTLRNWFFWTWRTGVDPRTGLPANPFWSYSLGLQHGYVPKNPRIFPGFCRRNALELGVALPRTIPWKGTFRPWMIGGEGAGQIRPDQKDKWGGFPITSLTSRESNLVPQYEKIGKPLVLPGGPKRDPVNSIDDWYAPVKGCEYPGPWEGADLPVPRQRCPFMSPAKDTYQSIVT